MPQVMEVSALSKLIGSIGKRRVALDSAIQTAAVQCIAQSVVHRNATPAVQLFDVLGKSTRRDSLVALFERFGNLMWSKVDNKVTFCDVEKLPGRTKLEWTAEYATKVEAVLWFNAKPEPKIKSVFDVEDAVSTMIANIERNIKKGGMEIKNADLYDRIASAFYGYRADLRGERAAVAAHKGATLGDLVEKHGMTPDTARTLLAAVKAEQEAAAAQAAPQPDQQVAQTTSPEKLDELVKHFGGEAPKLVVNQ